MILCNAALHLRAGYSYYYSFLPSYHLRNRIQKLHCFLEAALADKSNRLILNFSSAVQNCLESFQLHNLSVTGRCFLRFSCHIHSPFLMENSSIIAKTSPNKRLQIDCLRIINYHAIIND